MMRKEWALFPHDVEEEKFRVGTAMSKKQIHPHPVRDPDSLPHSEPGVPGKCLSLVVSGFRKLRPKARFPE
jgi:hypothetical protein